MKNIIIGLGLTALVIGILLWLGGPNRNANATPVSTDPSKLIAVETAYDFCTISMANGKVTHDFIFKNTDATDITINKMFTSCMCTRAVLIVNGKEDGPFGMPGMGFLPSVSETITPGAEGTIRVTFDPNAHGPAGVGTIDRVVTAQTDDGALLELRFHAVVTP